jgi:hypothetical protein
MLFLFYFLIPFYFQKGKGSVQVMGEPVKLDPSNPKHSKVIDFLNN